jgi:hypothetical protein|eukprot:COSAG06_NODE_28344_length_576_cov_0.815514_1_plen_68_part_00
MRFGRKGLLLATSAMLFAGSCFYRSLNIADEGAATCRNAPTAYLPWPIRLCCDCVDHVPPPDNATVA